MALFTTHSKTITLVKQFIYTFANSEEKAQELGGFVESIVLFNKGLGIRRGLRGFLMVGNTSLDGPASGGITACSYIFNPQSSVWSGNVQLTDVNFFDEVDPIIVERASMHKRLILALRMCPEHLLLVVYFDLFSMNCCSFSYLDTSSCYLPWKMYASDI